MPGNLKRCGKCRVEKPRTVEFFHRLRTKYDGLQPICKVCACLRAKIIHTKKIRIDRPIIGEKKCSKCKETKPVSEFHSRAAVRDGLHPHCKTCACGYARKRGVQVYATNPQKIRDRVKNWWINHPGVKYRLDKRYRESHREEIRARVAKWFREHPEARAAVRHARRSRMRGIPGRFTRVDVLRIYESQSGKCYYCHNPLEHAFHVDHKIPLSRTELNPTNWPDNMCCACGPCNLIKGSQTADEFMEMRNAG